jgi:hypothetical protein
MLKLLRLLRNMWIVLLLILSSAGVGAQPGGGCAGYCTYLPLVAKPTPLVITEATIISRRSFYSVQGTILNTSDQVLYDPIIETSLYNRQNQVYKVITGTALLSATLPGELVPFDYRLDADEVLIIDVYHHLVARIVGWRTPNPVETYYPLIVRKVASRPVPTGLEVDIAIHNPWAQPLHNIKLSIWEIPTTGTLGTFSIPNLLAPGESITQTYVISEQNAHFAGQGMTIP